MKIFIAGGTGFVGSALVNKLLEKGHQLKVLSLKSRDSDDKRKEIITGDITKPETLSGKTEGCDAVINLVGIIRAFPSRGITYEKLHYEATKNIVEETKKSGVTRYLHMSALGVNSESKSEYKRTKHRAEVFVQNSGLTYTIFKPSIIFGKDDISINMFADMIKRSPAFPIIGNGKYRMQPVALENVIDGYVNSLEMPVSHNKTYNICGPVQYTYNDLINTIGEVLNRKPFTLHVPKEIFYLSASLFDSSPKFPISKDQIHMLFEESICDDNSYFEELKISPVPFKEGISKYMK